MDRRGGQWITVTGWRAVVVTILLLPFILIFGLLLRPFLPRGWGKAERTPGEVAGYIRDFLDDTGGEWDWDDFTSVELKDPALDLIRMEADLVWLPLNQEGRTKLESLYAEARRLAAAYKA